MNAQGSHKVAFANIVDRAQMTQKALSDQCQHCH